MCGTSMSNIVDMRGVPRSVTELSTKYRGCGVEITWKRPVGGILENRVMIGGNEVEACNAHTL